ncbi:hypothetical protein ACGFX8_00350 [Streptomyces sp. NPDC048362]|uniref:hypothetical protein n=1 Tax=Streptomyces sp. NPDC048362 TaxID=3365539 RepID=UPI00372495A7
MPLPIGADRDRMPRLTAEYADIAASTPPGRDPRPGRRSRCPPTSGRPATVPRPWTVRPRAESV